MIDIDIRIGSEQLRLMPERALLRPGNATLYVADVHLGKAATFRAEQMPVPRGTTASMLQRLTAALERSGARRLVILGDLIHARSGRHPHTIERFQEWRSRHAHLPIELVRGNHDRHAGDPEASLDILCRDAPVPDDGFTLLHQPGVATQSFWLAGHLHPAVRLIGSARQSVMLSCFYLTDAGMVLPAFGDFTGRAEVFPSATERAFVIADDDVIAVARR